MADYSDQQDGTIWNFDDKESELIFNLKLSFIQSLKNWNLEQAYWDIDVLLTEADSLFKDNIRKEMNKTHAELSEYRSQYNTLSNPDAPDNFKYKSYYYQILRDFYKEICRQIVDEDLYFRKKKAYMGL